VLHERADNDAQAKVEQGWVELTLASGRDYQVYEEGRLVTPTKWTIRGAWDKVRTSTDPKLVCEGHSAYIWRGELHHARRGLL
jgi:hypothetical protein